MSKALFDFIKKNKIEFIDLRFTDILGTNHHVTLPAHKFKPDMLKDGKPFDGSSIRGWKGIENSDTILVPDPAAHFIDPFREAPTLNIVCDVYNTDGSAYNRDPRGLARRAEQALRKSGVADTAYFGPELEFFVFDEISWEVGMGRSFYEIKSIEAAWDTSNPETNIGHRPGVKGGYFPVPPTDSLADLRAEICQVCTKAGMEVEVHHHEVATAGQCEIGTRLGQAVERADDSQKFKYIAKNVAYENGKILTFMPKPLAGDNGTGMHVHQSLVKKGRNVFQGNKYGGLSQTALHYIGGILKHARAINAFTNPTTNSYKRLIPGFEAPTILGFSAHNRSVSIRIPHTADASQRRCEVRFPDAAANPYLAFPAMLAAGLDGIKNKIDPGKPMDKNMYEISEREALRLPQVSATLNDALVALDKDRKFLTASGIFDDDLIDTYIDLKIDESKMFRSSPHPIEFDLYFGC
ncbi:MAG: type I glutamate--ammonia ligase [Betaproteobacteria bacterium AqS2]|uniref:Glutamine synthetase n=1 Tax=Candidatus Amphirhobacter heronislandensis TaxID=1732024 RepID=A0A930UBH1_9GAMM|nr:type I glutamate--ammonia ligase [Betaproteobacteria bacterium AqS2]